MISNDLLIDEYFHSFIWFILNLGILGFNDDYDLTVPIFMLKFLDFSPYVFITFNDVL